MIYAYLFKFSPPIYIISTVSLNFFFVVGILLGLKADYKEGERKFIWDFAKGAGLGAIIRTYVSSYLYLGAGVWNSFSKLYPIVMVYFGARLGEKVKFKRINGVQFLVILITVLVMIFWMLWELLTYIRLE